MKYFAIALTTAGSLLVATAAFAGPADELKWIEACVKDNASGGASQDTIVVYCACMTQKMDNNETQSVTQWEKTRPTEKKQCETESGWK